MTDTIRTPAEVQADIDTLTGTIDVVSDQIFKTEQESTNYRAILNDPKVGTDNLVKLAMLREQRRALEIALEAARKDLEGAELNVLREETMNRRAGLKALLAERESKAAAVKLLIDSAVEGVLKLRTADVEVIKWAKLRNENVLTSSGYLVLDGIQVLNDPGLLQDWALNTLQKGLETDGKFSWDFAGQVKKTGINILRQWDIANATGKLKIIDHDPVQGADGEPSAATVEQFDPDPTEDDLASIADLPPEKAAKAMNAFANSKWGRARGLIPQPAGQAQG